MGHPKKEGRLLSMAFEEFFLLIGAVLLIGFMGSLIRQRTKIPEALFLIIFGLFIGPATGIVPGEALLDFVPIVSIAAMVLILVDAGIGFDFFKITAMFGKAAIFTVLIAILTTLFIAFFLVNFYGWEPGHAALLGIICSGTTTITAMSLLEKLNVRDKVKRLILLETIINDFTLIVGALLIIESIKFAAFGIDQAAVLLVTELSVAIVMGVAFGFVWRYVLEELNLTKELNYASTVGLCFVLYHVAAFFGGNSIIAIFAFSLFLGNYYKIYDFIRGEPRKEDEGEFKSVLRSIRLVQRDFTFFVKSFFFVLLGITFNPLILSRISVFLIGGIILLILVARFITTIFISRMDKDFSRYRLLMSVMIPRGYVAAALAFVPAQQGIEIPLFTDIVVILIIVTTIIAILGTALYASLQGNKRRE
jgi:cell volume regulation protein A